MRKARSRWLVVALCLALAQVGFRCGLTWSETGHPISSSPIARTNLATTLVALWRTLEEETGALQRTHFRRYTPRVGAMGQTTNTARPRISSRGTNDLVRGCSGLASPTAKIRRSPNSSRK